MNEMTLRTAETQVPLRPREARPVDSGRAPNRAPNHAPHHTSERASGQDAGSGSTGTPAPTSRLRTLIRGDGDGPTWWRPALLALLVATAVAYLINLTASGWANSFYSAAVQAGSTSWKAFFYGSSDAGNSITVDKPPAALWVMALSVRVFGLNSFAILMPEVLMGVATVGIVAQTVKRYFSAAAGILAGVVLALTPVAALMFRFNNPDALLVLLMALGAWATLKSIERGSVRWMVVVGVFIGLGFLTKTLQVMLVVPFFGIAYLVAARTTLRRRIVGSIAAVAAMVLSAGWWVAIVELVPASMRPYIGGSQDNSFLELTFGYNGFGRINGSETGSVGGGGGGTSGGNWGATGITRMFTSEIGGQISWLLPAALLLLVVGLVLTARRPRTDLRRAAYLVWGGWLVVTALTFSFMAGIFHAYYTVALAPAIAAVVGVGAASLWERRAQLWASITMGVVVGVTSVWAFLLLSQTSTWLPWLRVAILAVGLSAAVGLIFVRYLHRAFVPVVVGAAIIASLAGPAAYTVDTLSTGHTGSIVSAGPTTGAGGMGGPGGGGFRGGAGGAAPGGTTGTAPGGTVGTAPGGTTGTVPGGTTGGAAAAGGTAPGGAGGGMGGLLDASTPSTEVVAALSQDASSYTWVAAAIGSQNAAGLQLGTNLPVMAIGGFNGTDPSPTLAQFQQEVASGQIHYFLASSTGMGGGMGSSSGTASAITTWVEQSFTKVTIGSQTFYDLTQPVSASSTSSSTTSAAS